ncbi:hypothetical protein K491DRAFT_370353 [Lophiostoma macrostomum CBS 122681]|uniref:NACHT domain-containing protein n=1 Tax=Lophiostoma macrostomum CBS 122681 TaxID=1314788 RepID=A0A6A6TCI1_9PLEO|nr:hypothetical protein K491DRAFT_370353 [Lophiostoma macrostomum CBS 122681]
MTDSMDPLSILAVATSVVQFLDFAGGLLGETAKIYKSAEGFSDERADLHRVTKELIRLKGSLECPIQAKAASVHEDDLQSLCAECNRAAQELIQTLESIRDRGSSRWRSCLSALKSVWNENQIESLRKRLDAYRQQMGLSILVILREDICSSQSDVNEQLKDIFKAILDINTGNTSWQNRMSRKIHELQQSTLRDPANYLSTGRVEGVNTQAFARSLLSLLKYANMDDRHHRIATAHSKTFEWIYSPENPREVRWENYSRWLESSSKLYWITGKAGSGKSTLMKSLRDDPRTLEHLQKGSSVPVVTAGHFFWSPGTEMEVSQDGLIQSLLHQILSQTQEHVLHAFPDLWEEYYLLQSVPTARLQSTQIVRGFYRLLESIGFSKQVFLLIDGLDEYRGDHSQLAEFLKTLMHSPYMNLKICASSRPWVVFEDAFRRTPILKVEELTIPDIITFVEENFRRSFGFKALEREEPEYATKLVEDIARKSSGVFLWVSLVVRSLTAGFTNGDKKADLQARLDALPADLEGLFQRILESLDIEYQQQASELFQIFRASRSELDILTLTFADHYDAEQAIRQNVEPLSCAVNYSIDRMLRRLKSRCKGLLEVPAELSPSSTIQYLHRTVKDFIEKEETWAFLTSLAPTFDPNLALCTSWLVQLKTVDIDFVSRDSLESYMKCCIFYASEALRSPASIRVRLVDEMDSALQSITSSPRTGRSSLYKYYGNVYPEIPPHWSHIKELSDGTMQPGTFLNLMTHREAVWYIKVKLNQGAPIRQDTTLLPLLFNALVVESKTAPIGNTLHMTNNLFTAKRFHTPKIKPNIDLVRLLLQSGADPTELDPLSAQSVLKIYKSIKRPTHDQKTIRDILADHARKTNTRKGATNYLRRLLCRI